MFSGIITEIGQIVAVSPHKKKVLSLDIAAPKIAGILRIGDSVSVSGICLTVISVSKQSFCVEAMSETVNITTLGSWKPGVAVNLEPALRFGDSMGGHLVTGHIDGIVKIDKILNSHGGTRKPIKKTDLFEPVIMEMELPAGFRACVVPKGSITIDGVSLTVASLNEDSFSVALIPHTLEVTTLGKKRAGDFVNIETDMLGKFVLRYLEESFLEECEKLPARRKK